MIEEKGAMDVQNNTDSLGEGMTADRAQNIKGTLKRCLLYTSPSPRDA